jgi:hypothetical protein
MAAVVPTTEDSFDPFAEGGLRTGRDLSDADRSVLMAMTSSLTIIAENERWSTLVATVPRALAERWSDFIGRAAGFDETPYPATIEEKGEELDLLWQGLREWERTHGAEILNAANAAARRRQAGILDEAIIEQPDGSRGVYRREGAAQ